MNILKKLVGKASPAFLIISVLVNSLTFGTSVYAEDTGGYPWFDAKEINISNYDWGYQDCRQEMIIAKTCSLHYSYKNSIRYHLSDPWQYDVRNCTSFVAWKIFSIHSISIRGWGDAKNWDNMAVKSGYKVDTKPRQFDIAVWETGRYGHVAYVTNVNPDGSVNVEQYNKAGKGEFSRQSRVRADKYIHVAPSSLEAVKPIEIPTVSTIESIINKSISSEAYTNKDKLIAQVAPVINNDTEIKKVTENIIDDTYNDQSLEGKNYYIGRNITEDKPKLYEINHKKTKSGKVEIKTKEFKDYKSEWTNEIVTHETVTNNQAKYVLADYDADGFLDMYVINHGATNSGKVEISVLNGKDNFVSNIGKWVTTIPSSISSVWYGVADSNGDGAMDLYQISYGKSDSGYINLKVLDGKNSFNINLTEYIIPEKTKELDEIYYLLGDINDDGKTDIYQVWEKNTPSGYNEVKVFDGSAEHREILTKWQTDIVTKKNN